MPRICCGQPSVATNYSSLEDTTLPQLPSGLNLAISRDALFDHGGNWFKCPDGHFWYWAPSPEMGNPPFDPDREITQVAEHAPVPKNREEVKRFVRVLEMREDGKLGWRGEWLSSFPLYIELNTADIAAWNAWLSRPQTDLFLDETIAKCERLAETSRRAVGYATLEGTGQPDEDGLVRANLRVPSDPHEIPMHSWSEEFATCWAAAGRHLHAQLQGSDHAWLKSELSPPFLEHLSFSLGNQLFFIRIEDVHTTLEVPGIREGPLMIARQCKGHPCLMPMQRRDGVWSPIAAGWGLLNMLTGESIEPRILVTRERIEMTDWELHDFAVQVVRDYLEKAGKKLVSWQSNPTIDPSIWFTGENGPEWVVVRAVRFPRLEAVPANWQQIAQRCARLGKAGHFASVSVANADDAFDPRVDPLPLWRGCGMFVRFQGLAAGPHSGTSR
jgi:hypothetical protein